MKKWKTGEERVVRAVRPIEGGEGFGKFEFLFFVVLCV